MIVIQSNSILWITIFLVVIFSSNKLQYYLLQIDSTHVPIQSDKTYLGFIDYISVQL